MSENLRDKIAEVLYETYWDLRDGVEAPKLGSFNAGREMADAVLAVVGPELDRLRAEVERLTESERTAWAVHREHVDGMGPIIARHAGDATFARVRADRAEAERDVLRARLADVWDEGYTSGHSNVMRRMSDEPNAPKSPNPYRAALASVPEPSDSEPEQRCSQCGQGISDRACGPTHALLYAEQKKACEPEPSDSAPEPHRDAQDGLNVAPRSPRSPEGVSGAQGGVQRFESDADREAGER